MAGDEYEEEDLDTDLSGDYGVTGDEIEDVVNAAAEELVNDERGDASVDASDADGPAVDYESLRYIQLRGDGSKLPAWKWGGYDQDFDAAEHVHTHDEVVDHPAGEWGVVDCEDGSHRSVSLLIFDVDSHKAPDDFDLNRVKWSTGTLVTRSQNGGFHVYFKVDAVRGAYKESDFKVHENLPFDIDIRGSAVSHHVVAPNDIPGIAGEYEIVNDEPIQHELTIEDVCRQISFDDEPAVQYNPSRGFDGDGGSGYTPAGDEWLLEEDVTAALSHVSADLSYAEWRDIGFAVADYYARTGADREDAVKTFIDWSQTAPSAFDADAERNAENIIESGFESVEVGDDDRVTLGTLLSVAAANGWEWPDVDARKALRDVRAFIDEYDPVSDRATDDDGEPVNEEEWPSDARLDRVADAVTELDEDVFEDVKLDLAKRAGTSQYAIERHREITALVEENDGSALVNYDGELVQPVGRWSYPRSTLNFAFEVESRLSLEGEGKMATVRVTPSSENESPFTTQVAPRAFNDARRFKDQVLDRRFSTTIKSDESDSVVMDQLREFVAEQDVPDRVGQKQMGLSQSGDEFVTPNGTINADGWADEPETIHVERDIGAERKFAANPDDHDADEIDNEEVARIIELFTRTRGAERFLPVLGWMYAAPFRPEIVERTGSFNLCHVNGESGVGKTGSLGVGSRMFGMSAEPFSCTDTTFAQITTLASSRGVPIWLDEYKVSEMPDWQTNTLHELLRKAATGGVEQRGRADQTTEEYHLRAPVVVSGETAIRGSAEQRRSITTTFTNQPTRSGTPEFRRFKELAGDAVTDEDGNVTFPDARYTLENHAVEYYRYVAGMSEEDFETRWFNAREYVSKKLAEWDIELDDLEVQGLQTITFGYKVMRSFATVVGADLSKLPDTDELDNALRYVADVEGTGRETHIDQFTSLCQRAAVADYLEKDTHYGVVREGKPGEELRVNVTRAFDEVSKYVRDHDLNEDLLGSAKDYKDRFDEAVEQDTYVTTTSQGTPGVGRAVGIHTDRASEELAEFDRTAFLLDKDDRELVADLTPDEDDDEDGDSDDGDDPNGDSRVTDPVKARATPLYRIEDKIGAYPTVTAEVVEYDATPDGVAEAGGPVEAGSLKDETGRVDVVLFDGDEDPSGIDHLIDAEKPVRIRDVKVTEYEGNPQLVLDAGADITTIQRGVGHTEGPTPEDGQAALNDDGGTAVEADGGEPVKDDDGDDLMELAQNTRVMRVKDLIDELEGDSGAPVDEVLDLAVEKGFDREKVEHEIEKLLHKGKLYEPAEGRLRVV